MADLGFKNRIDENRAFRLYNEGLNDEQIAKSMSVSSTTVFTWRNRNGLPSHITQNRRSKKRCNSCLYWKNSNGHYGGQFSCFCHHLLETGKRRVVEDDECKSYKAREGLDGK